MLKRIIFSVNICLIYLLLSVFILASIACSSQAGNNGLDLTSKKVVARIDGEEIYEGDVFRRIQAAYGQIEKDKLPPNQWQMILEAAIDSEIADRLLLRAAISENIEIPEEKIEAIFQQSKQMLGEEGFRKMLEDNKSTEEEFRNFLKKRELISLYKERLYKDLKVEEDLIKKYYEGHKEKLFLPEMVLLEVITVKERDLADEIYDKYSRGKSLEELREFYSKAGKEFTARRLRLMPFDAIPVDIQPKVREAKEAEIIRPFPRGGEIYIIKVVDKQERKPLTFEEAKEEIRAFLLDQRRQKLLEQWLNMEKGKVRIEYLR